MTGMTVAVPTRTARPLAAVAGGLAGGVGAGLVFTQTANLLATRALMTSTYWLGTELTWEYALPVVYMGAALAVALFAGRWGWFVAAAATVAHIALTEIAARPPLGQVGSFLAFALISGAALGGAAAAFGAADRIGRLAVGAGLVVGLYSGRMALLGYMVANQDTMSSTVRSYLTIGGSALLALLAGVITLVAGSADRPAGVRRPGTPVWIMAVTLATIGLQVAMLAVLRGLASRSGSQRRQDAVETLHEVGLLGLAGVAALVLAVVAYRRSGATLARWVLVAFAASVAGSARGVWVTQPTAIWLAAAVALLGTAIGTGLARYAGGVPWDAIGLGGLAVGVLLTSPRGELEVRGSGLNLQLSAVFMVAFAVAVALARLAIDDTARAMTGVAEAAVSLILGFAAFFLATMVVFPASQVYSQYGQTGAGPALTIGAAAMLVLGFYGLGRLIRSVRRGIEAEAARQARGGAPEQP